jgi:hypothetical protein
MLYIKELNESIKKQELKLGETITYTLTKEDNIPKNKKVGDIIKGKVIKNDNGNLTVEWETGDKDENFPSGEVKVD